MNLFKKKNQPTEDKAETENGGRNLCILGLGALIIAIVTTSISLKIYHDTGDVYLDRSRPGFISDDEKNEEKENTKETFSDEGEIDAKVLDEYLKSLDKMRKKADDYSRDFAVDPLTDHELGIELTDEEPSDETEGSDTGEVAN